MMLMWEVTFWIVVDCGRDVAKLRMAYSSFWLEYVFIVVDETLYFLVKYMTKRLFVKMCVGDELFCTSFNALFDGL